MTSERPHFLIANELHSDRIVSTKSKVDIGTIPLLQKARHQQVLLWRCGMQNQSAGAMQHHYTIMWCLHLCWINKWLAICLESHAWMSLTCDTWPLLDKNEMLTGNCSVARGSQLDFGYHVYTLSIFANPHILTLGSIPHGPMSCLWVADPSDQW